MTHHILRDIHGDEFIAVVHGQRVADELRGDSRTSGPGLEYSPIAAAIQLPDLLEQMPVDKRTFFN